VDDFTRQFAHYGGNVSPFLRLVLFSSLAVTLSAQSGGDLVSAEELRNPLTGKSLRAIVTAQEHLKSGQRERGMQELRDAMSDPVTMPYAISMLGVEHLRAGQLDTALGELEQAVQVLPGKPENHSNLAYALYLKVQTERGLNEVRKALQLDGGMPKTRLVLGMLLLQQGSHEAEAIQQLQAAAEESPSAHLVLAQHYDRAGKAPEAEKERRAYAVTSMSLLAGK
jgi:Tfp pilus assembly protein PilF